MLAAFPPALNAVDHIDATDIDVLLEDGPYVRDGHARVYETHGMSRGLRDVVQRLLTSNPPRSVALLRFHGHGGAGQMVVSGGTTAYGPSMLGGEHFQRPEAVVWKARRARTPTRAAQPASSRLRDHRTTRPNR